ncbi:MAG: hypothetical protein EBR86_01435 [Planctomycetia bacterium]|nr:hypothetical protein [Planctomycetia bacterium]
MPVLDTLTTREELESIRSFLLHDTTAVSTEDGNWYVGVHSVCQHSGDGHRKKIRGWSIRSPEPAALAVIA